MLSDVPGIAKAFITAQFEFSRGHQAILIMHKQTTSRLEGIDRLLDSGRYEHLRGMRLVTKTVTCPVYAMYLSGKRTRLSLLLCEPQAYPSTSARVQAQKESSSNSTQVLLLLLQWE